jgi:hypothetical protein
MKKFIQFAGIIILLFGWSALAAAWTVTIKNSTGARMDIEVEGEHLFWRQIDCRTTIPVYKEGNCELSGGICPTFVYFTAKNDKGTYPKKVCDVGTAGNGAKCFNHKYAIAEVNGEYVCMFSYY